MNDLTTFRIDKSKYDRYGKQFDPVQRMITLGVLVPDDTLQAIADAWDEVRETGRDNVTDEVEWFNLESLLDALVERGSP